MRRFLFAFLLFTSACLSATAKEDFYIKGKIIATATDGLWRHTVYLSKIPTINDFFTDNWRTIADSAIIQKDGAFAFVKNKAIEDNTFYRLEVYPAQNKSGLITGGTGENFVILLLNKNSHITFTSELPHFSYTFALKQADTVNRAIRHLAEMDRKTLAAEQPLIEQGMQSGTQHKTSASKMKSLRAQIEELINTQNRRMRTVVDTVSNPYAALLTFMYHFSTDSLFCLKMNNRFQAQIPQSRYASGFSDMVYDLLYTLPIGSHAPDFTLPDRNGNPVSLSSFLGKYIVLDFWASWCQPCRMENREVVKPMIQKYKDRNFAVVSISMDTDGEKWKQALATDKRSSTELCDLQGVKSETAKIYRVTDVPVIYVLDPEGKIIAKNLHNVDLERFMAAKLP